MLPTPTEVELIDQLAKVKNQLFAIGFSEENEVVKDLDAFAVRLGDYFGRASKVERKDDWHDDNCGCGLAYAPAEEQAMAKEMHHQVALCLEFVKKTRRGEAIQIHFPDNSLIVMNGYRYHQIVNSPKF